MSNPHFGRRWSASRFDVTRVGPLVRRSSNVSRRKWDRCRGLLAAYRISELGDPEKLPMVRNGSTVPWIWRTHKIKCAALGVATAIHSRPSDGASDLMSNCAVEVNY